MVIENLPAPNTAQPVKCETLSYEFKRNTQRYLPVRNAICECNPKNEVVVFVAKMQPFPARVYDITVRAQ